jgi:hypothetical protein|tara:strand:- start:6570 stop:6755 length:186 start_codon:yes stop_codon:yes gene_type:complete
MNKSDLLKIAVGLLLSYIIYTMFNTNKAPGCGNCPDCQSNGCENCPGCQSNGCENCPGCQY